MYCPHHPQSWSQMKSLGLLLFCRLLGKLSTKNPTRLSLKPEPSSPAEAGGVAMLSTILFGCFAFFDLFALFVTCFTVSVKNVDPIAVSEARELTGGVAKSWKSRKLKWIAVEAVLSLPTMSLPWMSLPWLTAGAIPADLGSGRRLASTLLNADWCCLPRLCAGKSLSDMVREQSVQAHVALARLSFELFSDSGTVRSAGDNHEASQYRMCKKQRLEGQRYESVQDRDRPLIAYCQWQAEIQKRKWSDGFANCRPSLSFLAHLKLGDCYALNDAGNRSRTGELSPLSCTESKLWKENGWEGYIVLTFETTPHEDKRCLKLRRLNHVIGCCYFKL